MEQTDPEEPFYQDGKRFVPYMKIDSEKYSTIMRVLDPNSSNPGAGIGAAGDVVACRLSQDGRECYYYSTMSIRMTGDWRLMFRDDGSAWQNADNALYLYGTEQSIANAPYWLVKIKQGLEQS